MLLNKGFFKTKFGLVGKYFIPCEIIWLSSVTLWECCKLLKVLLIKTDRSLGIYYGDIKVDIKLMPELVINDLKRGGWFNLIIDMSAYLIYW